MKIAALIARVLLGLMFVVFGLNGFLHFIHQPPPTGLALQYLTVMTESHMFAAVYALQFIGGLLVLIPRTIPIGLIILGPIIANILLFHITMEPSGLPPGLVALILWAIVFYSVRANFAGVFDAPLGTRVASA